MLQLKQISKEYKTGELVQKALSDVTLTLRDNEFTAVLGPSGSGKSTLLNIIGGLDRYDSGDLIINGVSTKKYRDRDWDSYRNHTIGFIFQSYNLIPHQSVLANVELALIISGISREERRQRAEDALRKVGLGDQMHKKPNQMSGGQMQRVAIARALVNDPDILLADEPTGALDTETSLQVMDLLAEVARDRLVVMVTHNPDLADRYANRIVRLKDGRIQSDTNPVREDEEPEGTPVHKNLGKSSMSFLTALSLSFHNLMTKKARTILVSIAGSIGIIGIALIMALSNGVNTFIHNTEEDALSEYPLQIQKSSFDLSAMMGGGDDSGVSVVKKKQDKATERDMIARMFSRVSKNDLKSFKKWLDSGKSGVGRYSRSIEYQYDVTPRIYRTDGDRVIQVNPNSLLMSTGLIPASSAYSSMFSEDVFSPLPEKAELYRDAYQLKAGHWPENYHEAIVILDGQGNVSDMTLYTLGVKPYARLEDMVQELSAADDGKTDDEKRSELLKDETGKKYPYRDLVGAKFKLVKNSDLYTYDQNMKVWTDRSEDGDYMKKLVSGSEDLQVVGVIQPAADTDVTMLTPGIGYTADLVPHIMRETADSPIVRDQKQKPDIDVLSGKRFDSTDTGFDAAQLFSIDENGIRKAFKVDTDKLTPDASAFDFSGLQNSLQLPEMPGTDPGSLLSGIRIDTSRLDLQKIFSDLANDYLARSDLDDGVQVYLNSEDARAALQKNMTEMLRQSIDAEKAQAAFASAYQELTDGYARQLKDSGGIPQDPNELLSGFREYASGPAGQQAARKALDQMGDAAAVSPEQQKKLLEELAAGYQSYAAKNGYSRSLTEDFKSYLNTGSAQSILQKEIREQVNMDQIGRQISQALGNGMQSYAKELTAQLGKAIGASVQSEMQKIAKQFPEAVSFDSRAFMAAVRLKMDEKQMERFFASLMEKSSYEGNLTAFGYADPADPNAVVIYPKDFDAKNSIKKILDGYNRKMKKSGQEEKAISYTDFVGTLMSSVTRIVNVISWVLIAFVAISLVVSSIMIGVITRISVLERRKEIGILRAIGASKHNVSQVFNAETFITGLLAGGIGILISVILLFPANLLIHRISGRQEIHAVLPASSAAGLIVLSVVLTLLSGLFPARKAAKSDPVTALREE